MSFVDAVTTLLPLIERGDVDGIQALTGKLEWERFEISATTLLQVACASKQEPGQRAAIITLMKLALEERDRGGPAFLRLRPGATTVDWQPLFQFIRDGFTEGVLLLMEAGLHPAKAVGPGGPTPLEMCRSVGRPQIEVALQSYLAREAALASLGAREDPPLRQLAHRSGDLESVAAWMRRRVEDLDLPVHQEPIEAFLPQILEMEASYSEFPLESNRTREIEKQLRAGAEPLPVYVESGDPDHFIMEGRHRIVAFHRLGMKAVPVCRVGLKAQCSHPGIGRPRGS